MLSRISLISQKSYYHTLIKCTSASQSKVVQDRLFQSFTFKGFSTDQTEKKAESSSSSSEGTSSESSDGALLTRSPATDSVREKQTYPLQKAYSNPDEGQHEPYKRKQFQGGKQSDGGSGLFKKRFEQPGSASGKPDGESFEQYSRTKSYKLQQEIFGLIKDKIASADTAKSQHFYNKLQSVLSQQPFLDSMTLDKIKAFILQNKTLNDREVFDKIESAYPGEKIATSKLDRGSTDFKPIRTDLDSFQQPDMTNQEYENFMLNQQDDLLSDLQLNDPQKAELIIQSQENEDRQYKDKDMKEPQAEIDGYNEFLMDIKRDLIGKLDGLPKTEFDFDRVSQDIKTFSEQYNDQKLSAKHEEDPSALLKSREYLAENEVSEQFDDFLPETKEQDYDNPEQIWNDLQRDLSYSIKDELKSHHDQGRTLMKLNQSMRQKLITQIKSTRHLLSNTLRQKEKLMGRLEIQSKDFINNIAPNKNFDFIDPFQVQKHPQQIPLKSTTNKDFLTNSKSIEVYNNELGILIQNYQISATKEAKQQFINKIQQVIDLIHANDVQPNLFTKARFFQYGVITKNTEFANFNLKQVSSQESEYPYSIIDKEFLNKFYKQSLKADNFDGLGHLINYLEKYGVDISSWNLQNFSSALSFYLNKQFNLNNVLIFTKYYTYYHQCRLRNHLQKKQKSIVEMTESEKYTLNSEIFDNQYFVDMRSLFKFLVEKTGSKQVFDPVSKEDPIWKIIDFFTKGIQDITTYGQTNNNSISEKDIALYFKNHFNDSKTFERVTQVLVRLQDKQTLHNHIIQYLKEYQAAHNELPQSFSQTKVRSAYVRLKSGLAKQNLKLNEKTVEYFLYLFKSLKMWPEIIDLCENYDKFTQDSSSGVNEIKNYYLSDTLIQIPSKQHYYELVKSAVYEGKDQTTAGYITAMTKAHFKDGAVDHGLKFFEQQVQNLKDVKLQREEFMINLFDSVYGESKSQEVTLDEFKDKYLSMIELSNRCVKESFAVTKLQSVISGKDYDDIDTLFQLYLVKKQESQVLKNYSSSSLDEDNSYAVSQLSVDQQQYLGALRDRSQTLESKLMEKDVKMINQIHQVMKSQKLSFFDGMDEQSADQLQTLFNIQSQDQVEEILKRTSRVQTAIRSLRDKQSDTIEKIHDTIDESVEKNLKQNMHSMFQARAFPDRGIQRVIDQFNSPRVKKNKRLQQAIMANNKPELDMYNNYMLNTSPIPDENDPYYIMEEAHNSTLLSLKEELLEAMTQRKSTVLKIALQIFNKVQDQTFKSVKLSAVENLDEKEVVPKDVNEQLQMFDTIFNNPRSPIFSALKTIAQYKGDLGVPPLYKRDVESFLENDLDVESLQKENNQLESLTTQVVKSQVTLKNIQGYLLKAVQESTEAANVKDYKKWNEQNDQQLTDVLEARIKELYEEFKQTSKSATDTEDFDRDSKLSLMRDVLALEYGQQFTSNNSVFPSFYCQDLIVFGMENNVPEAVRLGEKMMSENGYILSQDLQMAVKNYLLENQEGYYKAAKKTGIIDNTSLYRNIQKKRNEDEIPVFLNLDDPYWQDFLEKNSKRHLSWKVPSYLAWDHKPHGILDEIFDMKKIKETERQLRNFL